MRGLNFRIKPCPRKQQIQVQIDWWAFSKKKKKTKKNPLHNCF